MCYSLWSTQYFIKSHPQDSFNSPIGWIRLPFWQHHLSSASSLADVVFTYIRGFGLVISTVLAITMLTGYHCYPVLPDQMFRQVQFTQGFQPDVQHWKTDNKPEWNCLAEMSVTIYVKLHMNCFYLSTQMFQKH